MRQINIGKKADIETRMKMSNAQAGDKSHRWKGGITPVYKAIRGRLEYKRWCKALLEKNNYTDFFTGARGGLLSCHHLISVSLLIRLYKVETIDQALACPYIWDLQNGIVMLKTAHDKFHNTYGDITNIYELTDAQIQELYSNP